MKNRIRLSVVLLAVAAVSSCTNLDVPIESVYTEENFPTTSEGFIAATGPVYTQLASQYAVQYWRMQEFSTDEAIIPARDGNYDDGGQYRVLHKHTWNPDHTNVKSVWEWGFGGINTTNRIMRLFEAAPESAAKTTAISEMRTMRALFHFFMMDLYGNIPLVTTWGSSEPPEQKTRQEVFAFIETELKESIPGLAAETGALTYGRPTKWLAYAILTKLYLNAGYYTGTAKNTETVAMADSILANGRYALEESFASIFLPDNGPQIKEIIFAVPYDANQINGNQFSRFGLHTALLNKFELPFRPSIAQSTIASFYAKFNLPGDERNDTWLAGKQYERNGDPILISTTNKGLDNSYSGPNPNAAIQWHLEFFPEMPLVREETMDVGNDELGKARGVRSIKYYPDKNANPQSRHSNNDVPVFRLADIMLMKAEAILRGAAPTTVNGELQTALVLVNKVRDRAKAPLLNAVALNDMLDERARELAWEAWRRNDLIRFGKYEDSWGYKTNNDVNMRLYPIPTSERALNPKLEQNLGY
ncbi:RagB/SusD family nutrient uptake outer membrane protein [Chitinophaga sp. XS-30]|uniref:RagB/SusD family nutrient uptake outer membrane protein n=1 Tax=Chitinophaga sp. XS-30 TaxID=2604421 RepID=UPI0011DD8367|nr:RagB/SusD family nutrient uptake outer membrane protein [Chitinophaga sp. XS-30]QEH41713.1 RagB/SusD family nutrient uptake outer membrane protein [Chitinophaga sp. XS-30]